MRLQGWFQSPHSFETASTVIGGESYKRIAVNSRPKLVRNGPSRPERLFLSGQVSIGGRPERTLQRHESLVPRIVIVVPCIGHGEHAEGKKLSARDSFCTSRMFEFDIQSPE